MCLGKQQYVKQLVTLMQEENRKQEKNAKDYANTGKQNTMQPKVQVWTFPRSWDQMQAVSGSILL